MTLSVIYPYLLGNTWAFDDSRTGLKEEAFVLGMSEMIARLVETKAIPQAAKGFTLQFDSSVTGRALLPSKAVRVVGD